MVRCSNRYITPPTISSKNRFLIIPAHHFFSILDNIVLVCDLLSYLYLISLLFELASFVIKTRSRYHSFSSSDQATFSVTTLKKTAKMKTGFIAFAIAAVAPLSMALPFPREYMSCSYCLTGILIFIQRPPLEVSSLLLLLLLSMALSPETTVTTVVARMEDLVVGCPCLATASSPVVSDSALYQLELY